MSKPWRLLNQTSSDIRLPPLLISTNFTSNSYTVYVTDLTYIWGESLDRRSIIKRSLDEDTSIDPSEDAEQLGVFLDKVQSALSGAGKTSLSIQAISSPGLKNPPSLDIYITVELPKGLNPLQWPIHLRLLPQTELSARLTIPVLRAQNARMRELDRLVEILKEKDHVIQKLVDKLDETGTELGHVFPGVAGKGGRKIPRKIAEEKVKGLGIFEVEQWKKDKRIVEEEKSNEDMKLVVKEIYDEKSPLSLDPIVTSVDSGNWLHWWDAAKEDPVEISDTTNNRRTKTERFTELDLQEAIRETAEEGDDDFQVQATPPHLSAAAADHSESASSPPTLKSQAIIQDSTDDEDDLDAPSQRSLVPDSVPLNMPPQKRKKLGTIRRPKAINAPSIAPTYHDKPTSPVLHTKSDTKHPVVNDEETASEDDGNPSPARFPTPPPLPILPAHSTRKFGLGKIGGKARQATPPPITAAPEEEEVVPAPQDKAHDKPKPKLGVIGHKPAPEPSAVAPQNDADDDADHKRGRSAGLASRGERERSEEPRETSRERADRKREELKRMLEEKAKAPARKKRKF